MLSLEQLSKQVEAYRYGKIDFDAFEDWFQSMSWGAYDRAGEPLSDAIFLVRVALASYELNEIDDMALEQELANAVLPPRSANPSADVVVGPPRIRPRSANSTKWTVAVV